MLNRPNPNGQRRRLPADAQGQNPLPRRRNSARKGKGPVGIPALLVPLGPFQAAFAQTPRCGWRTWRACARAPAWRHERASRQCRP
jgi:hypothetical protein